MERPCQKTKQTKEKSFLVSRVHTLLPVCGSGFKSSALSLSCLLPAVAAIMVLTPWNCKPQTTLLLSAWCFYEKVTVFYRSDRQPADRSNSLSSKCCRIQVTDVRKDLARGFSASANPSKAQIPGSCPYGKHF